MGKLNGCRPHGRGRRRAEPVLACNVPAMPGTDPPAIPGCGRSPELNVRRLRSGIEHDTGATGELASPSRGKLCVCVELHRGYDYRTVATKGRLFIRGAAIPKEHALDRVPQAISARIPDGALHPSRRATHRQMPSRGARLVGNRPPLRDLLTRMQPSERTSQKPFDLHSGGAREDSEFKEIQCC